MERYLHIDILKGVAIILVVMGHLFVPSADYIDSTLNQIIYSFHMPLFFFLSGFVFPVSVIAKFGKETAIKAVVKKILSLILPFLSFALFYCVMKDKSPEYLFLQDETHCGYWFTLVLFEIFSISYFIQLILKHLGCEMGGGIDALVNFCIIVLFLAIAKMKFVPEFISDAISTDKVFKFYMFYQLGKFVQLNKCVRSVFENQYMVFACFIAYCLVFHYKGYQLVGVNVWCLILPIVAIVVLYSVALRYGELLSYKNILPTLGAKSLDIYFIHLLFLKPMSSDIVNGFGVPYLQFPILLLITLAFIGLSLLISLLINSNDVLSFVLLGKGSIPKRLLSKLK